MATPTTDANAAAPAQALDFDVSSQLAKEKFAEGIAQLLVPVVQELDNSVLAVRDSQIELFREIERLSSELQKFAETSKSPSLDAYVQKLTNARRRITGINTSLKATQERLDRINASVGRRRPGP